MKRNTVFPKNGPKGALHNENRRGSKAGRWLKNTGPSWTKKLLFERQDWNHLRDIHLMPTHRSKRDRILKQLSGLGASRQQNKQFKAGHFKVLKSAILVLLHDLELMLLEFFGNTVRIGLKLDITLDMIRRNILDAMLNHSLF